MKFTFEPDELEILQGIVEECSEHLHGIEEGILKLEMDFHPDLLDSVFRALHSVKGVSSFVDFVPLKETAHSLESFLTDMKKGIYTATSEITDLLLRGVDILNLLVGQLRDRVAEIESPPRDAFSIDIEEYGFRTFIKEADRLREEVSADSTGTSETKKVPVSPADSGPGLELAVFSEQMLADFMEETAEHLEAIEQECVNLEKHSSDPQILNSILRGFHSIKGGAGVIASMQDNVNDSQPIQLIKRLTHAAETLLQGHRNNSTPITTEEVDLILAAVDRTGALVNLVKGGGEAAPEFETFITRVEDMFSSEQLIEQPIKLTGEPQRRLPQQLEAFLNITNQALESIVGIINTAQQNLPVNGKRIKQYIRALNNVASTARYLKYDEVIEEVEKTITKLDAVIPDKDVVSRDLLNLFENNYTRLKELLEIKVNSIKNMIEQVPEDYAQKRIGEILVNENKVTPQQLQWALEQQKKLGTILVTSGVINQEDMEMALSKQAVAQQRTQEKEQRTAPEIGQSIRVSQDKLDRLMNMIGELLISKNRVFHLASRIGVDYQLPALSREFKNVAADLGRISDELQDAIMSVRMVPLRVLFQRYPRTVRDTSRKAGKQVELNIEGEDIELDKKVMEAINDPLVHMLRNAVDHAIELPQVRQEIGKPAAGSVKLKAFYQGNFAVIEVADDGGGLNPPELKLKALKKGLITSSQIESMTDDEAYQLIFAPGFSTRDEVSELSGRGVGMDVVKNNIEGVGGTIGIISKVNVGTTFTLKIPLSMSIIKGLMVSSSGQQFIIPLDCIEETVKLPPERLRTYKKSIMADIRGQILPLVELNRVLSLDTSAGSVNNPTGLVPVVVIAVDGLKFGLIIDSFQKEQEFVIKSLVEELASIKVYAGATILGDGSVVLILNPAHLLQMKTPGTNRGDC